MLSGVWPSREKAGGDVIVQAGRNVKIMCYVSPGMLFVKVPSPGHPVFPDAELGGLLEIYPLSPIFPPATIVPREQAGSIPMLHHFSTDAVLLSCSVLCYFYPVLYHIIAFCTILYDTIPYPTAPYHSIPYLTI